MHELIFVRGKLGSMSSCLPMRDIFIIHKQNTLFILIRKIREYIFISAYPWTMKTLIKCHYLSINILGTSIIIGVYHLYCSGDAYAN